MDKLIVIELFTNPISLFKAPIERITRRSIGQKKSDQSRICDS